MTFSPHVIEASTHTDAGLVGIICSTLIFTITYRFDAAQVVRLFFHTSLSSVDA